MIKSIILREILDSRGNATIEAELSSEKNTAIAAAPSGASVGKHEVPAFPQGGAVGAIKSFESSTKEIIGLEENYHVVDSVLNELDPDNSKFGGNLSIAISLAAGKLQALEQGVAFYELFGTKYALPFPLGNVIGGGAHSGRGSPEIQEFLSIPIGAPTFKEAAFANAQVHKEAGKLLLKKDPDFTRARSDEGAWAPKATIEEALDLLSKACETVSKSAGFEIRPGLDVAASEFYNEKTKTYTYKIGDKTAEQQIDYMASLVEQYNLYYLEDPFQEDDFDSFTELTKRVGSRCLVVGDDLVTTNYDRLKIAVQGEAGNALIVKPNQIGSLSETEKVINYARDNRYSCVVSHRSGETTDASIAHMGVGYALPVIKTGITGGERIAKLNEVIRIESNSKARMAKLPI